MKNTSYERFRDIPQIKCWGSQCWQLLKCRCWSYWPPILVRQETK